MGAVLTARPAPPAALAWLVWGLAALLYLVAFYQRVAPAVITQELSRDFGLSAASLGNLSAFYFYGYVGMQIPTGLFADRFGPRRVLAMGALLTAAGTMVFAMAPSVAWANLGRLFIGGAAGVAFVCMLKLATHWMPFRRFAFTSGVALSIGVAGATLAGAPLRVLVDAFGWRAVMYASAALTAAIAIAIWVVVRDDPEERGYASYFTAGAHEEEPSMLAGLREVLGYRNTWLSLLVPGGISCIILTFAGLWGVPFLVSQYGFSTPAAATVCSAMLIGWSVSSMVYGPLSQRIGRRKPLFFAGIAATMAIWSVVALVPNLPVALLVALLVGTSLTGGVFILTFAFAKESVPSRLGGTVSGISNMGVMLGGMTMQPLVGFVLDRMWSGATANGARVYAFADYRAGFALMLAWGALSLGLLALAKETYCRPFEGIKLTGSSL